MLKELNAFIPKIDESLLEYTYIDQKKIIAVFRKLEV